MSPPQCAFALVPCASARGFVHRPSARSRATSSRQLPQSRSARLPRLAHRSPSGSTTFAPPIRFPPRKPRRLIEARATPSPPPPADALPPEAPDPGGNFYLGAAGALSLLALALPSIVSSQAPSLSVSSHYTMLALVYSFALAHSGLASLRPAAVREIGERAYRVLFAAVSLAGAGLTISYFVGHRYDGMQLWTLQGIPGLREAVYAATFVSFLLLYPATFNLAEVAAIKKPGFRIYETGVMRITRHPQLWGQVMWCVAHCAWMGTSLSVTASLGLVAHHCFAVWHGDRRLRARFGEEWDAYASRTSVLPFRAVVDGRQKIAWRELAVKAYAGVIVFIVGAYAAHPAMLRAVASLQLDF